MKITNWFRLIFLLVFLMGILYVVLGIVGPEDESFFQLNDFQKERFEQFYNFSFYSGLLLAIAAIYVLCCSIWWKEPEDKIKIKKRP